MRTLILVFVVNLSTAVAFAQSRTDATLKITVVDESGGVIVGARVDVKPLAGRDAVTVDTGGRGDATFAALVPGRYAIHVEAPGFEPGDVRDGSERRWPENMADPAEAIDHVLVPVILAD